MGWQSCVSPTVVACGRVPEKERAKISNNMILPASDLDIAGCIAIGVLWWMTGHSQAEETTLGLSGEPVNGEVVATIGKYERASHHPHNIR
jgi:hypothetical protein